MTIHCTCPSCGAGVLAPDDAAGRTRRCAKCKARLTVPNHFAFPPTVAEAATPPPVAAPASDPWAPSRLVCLRMLWALYFLAAAAVGWFGYGVYETQPSAVHQAATAGAFAFCQLTGYCLMRALDGLIR